MTNIPHRKAFRLTSVIALLVGVLMFASYRFEPLAWVTFPFTWPGFVVLDVEETQERYGEWGELLLFWLCSLPCIAVYSWLFFWWRDSGIQQENQPL
jgi:hypothetical protein